MPRLRRSASVVLLVALALSAGGAGAQSTLDDARAEREQVRRQRAAAAAQLDVARAEDAELAAALEALTVEVNAQQALVADAERRLAAAEAAREAAEVRVAEAAAAQEHLWADLRERAVAGFVGQGTSDGTSWLLSSDDPTESLRRSALLAEVQADTADVLEELRGLEEDRVLAQAEADAAVGAAGELRAELAGVLAELEAQRAAQAAVKAELEQRVAGWQSQVDAFSAEEEQLTSFIQAEVAAEEARRAAAEEARRRAEAEAEARRQAEASAAAASADDATDDVDADAGGDESPPPRSAAPAASSGSGYQWPIDGRVSSPFGYRVHPIFGTRRLHAGIDIGAGSGTPIHAAGSGTVLFSGWRNGYGNTVMILHDDGLVSLYAHQTRTAVATGASVGRGEVVGYVGSTGWSTGPHLHFEIRVDGSPVDPRPYLP